MRANTQFLALIGCAVSVAGCSGLGINGLGGETTTGPSPNVRQNVNGDTFNYTITGTYSQTGGVQNIATTGSESEVFAAGTYAGQPALSDTATTSLLINGTTTTLIDGKEISATDVILGQTDTNVMQTVSVGGFTLPQTLSTTTTFSGTETLTNGTTVTVLYNVTGTTSVTTPAGTFACWTEIESVSYSDGFSSTHTIDFAPSIGAVVQDTVQYHYSSGLSENLVVTLGSYTFGA